MDGIISPEEVKSISVKDKVNDLKKDIKTLKWFLEKANIIEQSC
ncbi:MAG: hypothetical protein QXI49_06795 [Candidatus Methanomethylicaceae archaeon]